MPASLPGESDTVNRTGAPSAGIAVLVDPVSGPKNSPLDARMIDYSQGSPPGWNATTKLPIYAFDNANASTGGLNTGIGFGFKLDLSPANASGIFQEGNFFDDNDLGMDLPSGVQTAQSMLYIGGGRTLANGQHAPYRVDEARMSMAGGGRIRDAGSQPNYSGTFTKIVTAPTDIADLAVIETGFTNRSGGTLRAGQSTLASGVSLNSAAIITHSNNSSYTDVGGGYTPPVGVNRLLVAMVGYEDDLGTTAQTLSFGGKPMTRAVTVTTSAGAGPFPTASIWYMKDADLPPFGSGGVFGGFTTNTDPVAAGPRVDVITLHNVDQSNPVVSVTSDSANNAAKTQLTLSLPTTDPGGYGVAVVIHDANASSGLSMTSNGWSLLAVTSSHGAFTRGAAVHAHFGTPDTYIPTFNSTLYCAGVSAAFRKAPTLPT